MESGLVAEGGSSALGLVVSVSEQEILTFPFDCQFNPAMMCVATRSSQSLAQSPPGCYLSGVDWSSRTPGTWATPKVRRQADDWFSTTATAARVKSGYWKERWLPWSLLQCATSSEAGSFARSQIFAPLLPR